MGAGGRETPLGGSRDQPAPGRRPRTGLGHHEQGRKWTVLIAAGDRALKPGRASTACHDTHGARQSPTTAGLTNHRGRSTGRESQRSPCAVPLEEGLVTPTIRRPSWPTVGRAVLNPAQAAGSGTRPPGFSIGNAGKQLRPRVWDIDRQSCIPRKGVHTRTPSHPQRHVSIRACGLRCQLLRAQGAEDETVHSRHDANP